MAGEASKVHKVSGSKTKIETESSPIKTTNDPVHISGLFRGEATGGGSESSTRLNWILSFVSENVKSIGGGAISAFGGSYTKSVDGSVIQYKILSGKVDFKTKKFEITESSTDESRSDDIVYSGDYEMDGKLYVLTGGWKLVKSGETGPFKLFMQDSKYSGLWIGEVVLNCIVCSSSNLCEFRQSQQRVKWMCHEILSNGRLEL